MKSKSKILSFFVIIAIGIIAPTETQAQSSLNIFNVSTHLPAPNAMFSRINLREHPDDGSPCVDNEVSNIAGQLLLCGNDGNWDEPGTIWQVDTDGNVELRSDYADNDIELIFGADPDASVNILYGGFYAEGVSGINIPVEGAGIRMLWHAGKGAFRAGRVMGTQWDDVNTGSFSFATGSNNTASGDASAVVGGDTNTASGVDSTILGGTSNTASGDYVSIINSADVTATGTNMTIIGQPAAATSPSTDDAMIVYHDYVGIGIEAPDEALEVNGNVTMLRDGKTSYAVGSLAEDIEVWSAYITSTGVAAETTGPLFNITWSNPGQYTINYQTPPVLPKRYEWAHPVITAYNAIPLIYSITANTNNSFTVAFYHPVTAALTNTDFFVHVTAKLSSTP